MPDERVDKLSAMYHPKKTIYAQISFVDPPPPPAKPEDPAAKLPAELAQADGLVQVVRNFDGGLGAPDPAGEYRAFVDELILHDLITVERRLERIAAERQRGRDIDNEEIGLLNRALEMLNAEQTLEADPEIPGHPKLRGFGLLSAKPRVVVANNPEDDPEPPDLGIDAPAGGGALSHRGRAGRAGARGGGGVHGRPGHGRERPGPADQRGLRPPAG